VLDAYLDGSMLDALQRRTKRVMKESIGSLKPEEAAVMALLQNRLAREEAEQTKNKRKKT
jgi:DNA topoisomerase-1